MRGLRTRPASGSRRRALAVLVVGVLAAGLTAACSGGSSHAAASPSAASGRAGPVHHVGSWIVDAQGRVVISHGFNLVWKTPPYYPPAFSAADAKFLVSNGFTGVRLGVIWSGLEPQPGSYDQAYAHRIAQINGVLAKYGVRTLVDFHQDFYASTYTGDGAPTWAVLDPTCTATSTCTLGDSPRAFQAFWDDKPVDGVGLIQHYAGAWKALLHVLGNPPNLLGLDVMNEPYAGSASSCGLFAPCPAFEQGQLADFYRTLVAAIRTVNPSALVFYEPVPQLHGDATALPAPLDKDPALGVSFHYYDRACDLIANPTTPAAQAQQDARCTPAETAALQAGVAYAKRAGAAADLGEFGGSPNYTDDANMVDVADRQFLSWTYWEYYDGAAEPGGHGGEGGMRTAADREQVLDTMVVPYPEAVAGTPTSYSYDRANATMTFGYSTAGVDPKAQCRGAVTEIFVPQRDYPTGYAVHVTGGTVLSPPTWPWVEVRADPGAHDVTVHVTRRAGSTTQVPTTAVDQKAPSPSCH